MDKTVIGLLGAVGALVAGSPMQPATAHPLAAAEVLRASSYADLLKPIPNALALVDALASAPAEDVPPSRAGEAEATVQPVQYYHHHHHRYYRRRYHRHHHHHHHHHY